MKVGYSRVSTTDQSTDVQNEQLMAFGCERIYDEQASAKDDDRPELQAVLAFLRAGDVLVVTKLDRLARNTVDMLTIIGDLGKRGVKFTSIAEPWANTDSPAAEMLLTMMAGVATFERARMKERQKEGIERAKAQGVYRGGKQRHDPAAIRALKAQGKRNCEIARLMECSEDTVERALKDHDEKRWPLPKFFPEECPQ